jgi:hypothetical protein
MDALQKKGFEKYNTLTNRFWSGRSNIYEFEDHYKLTDSNLDQWTIFCIMRKSEDGSSISSNYKGEIRIHLGLKYDFSISSKLPSIWKSKFDILNYYEIQGLKLSKNDNILNELLFLKKIHLRIFGKNDKLFFDFLSEKIEIEILNRLIEILLKEVKNHF